MPLSAQFGMMRRAAYVMGQREIIIFCSPSNVRFASKADIRNAKRHVRFTPNSGH